MDVARYSIQINISSDPFLCIHFPKYTTSRTFDTYTPPLRSLSERIYIMIVNNVERCIKSMVSSCVNFMTNRKPIMLASTCIE